jgi:hypothetical protein
LFVHRKEAQVFDGALNIWREKKTAVVVGWPVMMGMGN